MFLFSVNKVEMAQALSQIDSDGDPELQDAIIDAVIIGATEGISQVSTG